MTESRYAQGGDAKAIGEIAKAHFGDFTKMFEHHGWPERGAEMMRKVQTRVVETYGSVRAFEAHYQDVREIKSQAETIWKDTTSVIFTSLWDWEPEHWGAIGWTGPPGRTHRDNLLKELTDPFVCVCYVTGNARPNDPDLAGKFAGFFILSHETGSRDEFTHPIHHGRFPNKWQHSIRPLRAFQYLPEYRPVAIEVFPDLSRMGRVVSKWGEAITDRAIIDRLRGIPSIEVPVFSSRTKQAETFPIEQSITGMVRPGPASSKGYEVLGGTQHLPRELYVLQLSGDVGAYLGRSIVGKSIYKIGLSVSPSFRRQSLQKSMPRGSFEWVVRRTTRNDGHPPYSGFSAAEAGETAMKVYLLKPGVEWLGGEFYLASEDDIEAAWIAGRNAALRVTQ